MTELSTTSTSSRFVSWLQNPITVKELRSRMRGGRAFVVLTLHALFLSFFIAIIYASYAANSGNTYGPDPRDAGKTIFTTISFIQAFVIIFVGPSFTAGAISGEKERQTYDILRTTLLTSRRLIAGKLLSSIAYVLLLILAALPIQSVAFFLGGVSLAEMLVMQLLLIMGALFFAMLGLFFSSVMRSTLTASVTTFATALFIIVGIPVIVGLASSFIAPFLFNFSSPSWEIQALLVYAGLFLAGTNLPATMIISEIFLMEEGALFAYKETFDGHMVWLISPWLFYVAITFLLTWLLFGLTVRRINKLANN